MQIPVSQFIIASKDNIAEKPLKKFCGLINIFIKVIVICTHQGISEIPGIFFKRRIVYIYSKGLQILDDEYGCRSGVSFRKRVDLPDTGSKSGNMFNKILLVKAVVFKGFFLFKIIIQRWHDISVITVNYGKEKDQAISYICRKLEKEKYVTKDIFNDVSGRESTDPTSYNNMVAIPHASTDNVLQNCVYVLLNEKPISWGRRKVNLVIFMAMQRELNEDLEQFLDVIIRLFESKNNMKTLLEAKDYDSFLGKLSKIAGLK